MVRMRVLLLFLVACAGPAAESARWPAHRHHHDEQLEQLQKTLPVLEERLIVLEKQVEQLRVQLSPPAPQPAP